MLRKKFIAAAFVALISWGAAAPHGSHGSTVVRPSAGTAVAQTTEGGLPPSDDPGGDIASGSQQA